MKKTLLTLSILSAALAAHAQDLRQFIPHNAVYVGSVHPNIINQQANSSSLKHHFLTKPFIEPFVQNFVDEADDFKLESLGINNQVPSYYYYQKTDSINYQVQVYALNNSALLVNKIEDLELVQPIQNIEGYNLVNMGDGKYYLFDATKLFIINADLETYYYYKDKNNRYGLKNVNFYDHYDYKEDPNNDYEEEDDDDNDEDYDDDAVTTVEVTEAVDSAMAYDDVIPPPTIYRYQTDNNQEEETAIEVTKEDAPPAVIDYSVTKNVEASPVEIATTDGVVAATAAVASIEPSEYYKQAEESYSAAYKEQQNLVDSITNIFVQAYISELTQQKTSILADKNYVKSVNKNAYANVYVRQLPTYNPLHWYTLGLSNAMTNTAVYPDYYSANLVLDDEKIDFNYNIALNKEQAKKYKKVEKRKVNKKLLKYLNYDKDIAALSYAFNTEQYLNFTYDQFKQLPFPEFSDEARIATDIVQLFLDEQAIGEAVQGDGIFVITGINDHQYNYITYDYDDDYNYKEIRKEKNERLPDFLYAYSTKNSLIHRKVLDYVTKYKYIKSKDGIYSTTKELANDMPYQLHILVKNDIIFLSTQLKDIKKIAFDKYPNKSNCSQKRKMRKHTVYGYFRPEMLKDQFKTDNLEMNLKVNNILNNLGQFEWKQPKMKCRNSKGTITAEVGQGANNALDYMLQTIDKLFELR